MFYLKISDWPFSTIAPDIFCSQNVLFSLPPLRLLLYISELLLLHITLKLLHNIESVIVTV